jgi:hypothetical protein
MTFTEITIPREFTRRIERGEQPSVSLSGQCVTGSVDSRLARRGSRTTGVSCGVTPLSTTDDFERANQSGLGTAAAGWSWTDLRDSTKINNGFADVDSGSPIARSEFEAATTTHYAQVDVASAGVGGVGVGFGGTVPGDGYMFIANNSGSNTYRIFKYVSGTLTQLAVASTTAPGTNFTARLEVDADGNLDAKIDGVSVLTHTDTSVALGTKTAIYLAGGVLLDDFAAGDI